MLTNEQIDEQVSELMRLVNERVFLTIGGPRFASHHIDKEGAAMNAVEAFVRAALERSAVKWLPVESAPTDCTSVLALLEGRVEIGFCGPNKSWIFERNYRGNPTHWMPFPPAPKD